MAPPGRYLLTGGFAMEQSYAAVHLRGEGRNAIAGALFCNQLSEIRDRS